MTGKMADDFSRHYSKVYGTISVEPEDSPKKLVEDKDSNGPCYGAWQSVWRKLFPSGYWQEFRGLIRITWPITLTMLFQYISGPLAVVFSGHLGTVALDSVSLANTLISITCIAVATGLATASDTIFSQLYGSTNRRKLGVALQRSLYIMTLAVFPVWAIHLNADIILKAIGEDPQVADYAQRYLEVFMPGVLSFFLYSVLAKYLQNQNIVIPNLIIGFISLVINAVLHYTLLFVLKTGIIGSAIAQAVGYSCMFLFTLAYILISGIYKDTWEGWSYESLEEWGVFFRLAMYGLFMGCLEWSYELGVFLSGLLGITQLGAQTILYELCNVAYMVPTGTGIAASIRVGQFLGSSDPDGAVTASGVAISITWAVAFLCATITVAFRWQLPLVFTNVDDVLALVASLLPVAGLCQFLAATMGVSSGILRGCGRQNRAALLFLVYMTVMLPVTIPVMLLSGAELSGFWWSYAATLLVPTSIFLIVILKTNWAREVQHALERTKTKGYDIKTYHSYTGQDECLEDSGCQDSVASLTESTDSDLVPLNPQPQSQSHRHSRRKLIFLRSLTFLAVFSLFLISLSVKLSLDGLDTSRPTDVNSTIVPPHQSQP